MRLNLGNVGARRWSQRRRRQRDAEGRCRIDDHVADLHNARQTFPTGWSQTTPGNGYGFKVTLAIGQQFSGALHGSAGS